LQEREFFVIDQEREYVYFPLKIKETKDRQLFYFQKKLENPKPYPTSQSMERKAALSALLN